ncbi:MAG: CaiB/BaiF CoA transferase family protein [Solirubrobacteraceae bacterium]
MSAGPLAGLRVVELASIGPGPFCGMMLADMGADVVRVERPGTGDVWTRSSVLDRGRQRVVLDLKARAGVDAVLSLVQHADVLIEGLRPGVAERLGVGPAECLARNARLVFGRVTGWGQSGPYSHTAGHDITYLATTGALHAIGREGERPVPPVNLLGDFGGGGMLLAFGVLCAVIHARETGRGQIVDAAIVDGAISLTSMLHGLMASGSWEDVRGVNLFDGGAPFYDTYECADGRHVAVGALEAKFFATLAERLGLTDDPAFTGDHLVRARWPAIRARLTETFLTRTRDDWSALLRDSDACVAPVLSLREAAADEANLARGAFQLVGDELQPAPAPRFSEAPVAAGRTPPSRV